eukprot:NODE_343_length_10566_cov_0.542371.p8 type:complete len:108 gc:universal NODE_343_length_10566_cov_0.542371:8936-8613(-)
MNFASTTLKIPFASIGLIIGSVKSTIIKLLGVLNISCKSVILSFSFSFDSESRDSNSFSLKSNGPFCAGVSLSFVVRALLNWLKLGNKSSFWNLRSISSIALIYSGI